MALAPVLQRAWLRRGPLACLLWPLSRVFGVLAAMRRAAYRVGLLRRGAVDAPVVVVGNVVAGGAGKTPVVVALVEHLRSRGLKAGVISRGHGRSAADCREVKADSRAGEVGDEPLLIARSVQVPVFVATRRLQAAQALLAAYPATQVIVSDDGLQHYRLQRDLEICVFDERGVGNGWLLPAGPLREPWPRQVDLVLRSGATAGVDGFDARRRLAGEAVRADGTRIELTALQGRPIAALAAIAGPERFFTMLRERGLRLARTVELPDHDAFDSMPPGLEGIELVCTEKDAVKVWWLRPDAWAVPLQLEIDPAFWSAFDRLLDAKLSSRDGLQTT
ncbi:MAG TPA: tetraacyldisaccharide 4'-kinase [Ramlibacter sp.]|nr:tetraacyldisaccharide 4'-kinase [Ramlibacter sp.]